jgi:hypothetical protein
VGAAKVLAAANFCGAPLAVADPLSAASKFAFSVLNYPLQDGEPFKMLIN